MGRAEGKAHRVAAGDWWWSSYHGGDDSPASIARVYDAKSKFSLLAVGRGERRPVASAPVRAGDLTVELGKSGDISLVGAIQALG